MISSSSAHFVTNMGQSLIEREINGNILLKSAGTAGLTAGVETLASSVCHQIGVAFPQEGRTFLDQVTHKVMHGLTAAGASVLMGNPDAALASALGAVVGEIAIETLDAMDQKPAKSMTPQERQALEKMEAQKELDQKTNTSIFKMAIQKRNIANLAAALFLTLTTPDHLVAEAYHAAGRAMDFNHDVSAMRAQDKQVEEEEPRLVFEDGYESDTSYKLRKAVLKREKSLSVKQVKGQSISLVEQYELDSLIDAYEERATRSAEVRAWKKTHQWMKEHPKRAAALGAGGVLMTASGVMTSTGVGIIPAATTSALGSALLDYGLTDESVPTTKKAINMGKAATLGAVPYLKFSHMLKASGGIALYGYAADDSMMKWGGGLTFAGSVLVKGVQTLVKGACVVPSSSISHGVEALGLDVPKKSLLSGEGKVGTYGDLKKLGKVGDNLTPNHVPQAAYMKDFGVKSKEGVSMLMEHPHPGTGGRHRLTRTYGKQPDMSIDPRTELSRDIEDIKQIYKRDGLYTKEIRESLQEVIKLNKEKHPHIFNKK